MLLFWSRRPGHSRTKIGRNRFLTYFGSAMSDIQLKSEKTEKIQKKSFYGFMGKLMCEMHPKVVPLRMPLLALHMRPYMYVIKASGRFPWIS